MPANVSSPDGNDWRTPYHRGIEKFLDNLPVSGKLKLFSLSASNGERDRVRCRKLINHIFSQIGGGKASSHLPVNHPSHNLAVL
jgi:hypothetical protein